MKALKTTLALLLLGASAAAPAEVICKDCTYTVTDPAAGTYLGAYWPGDRGSFKWRTQFVTAANSFWVIDLNANGTLVFTASTPAAAPFIAFRAELYHDSAATFCNVPPGGFCEQVSFYPLIGCTFIEPGQDQCQQVPFVADSKAPMA